MHLLIDQKYNFVQILKFFAILNYLKLSMLYKLEFILEMNQFKCTHIFEKIKYLMIRKL